MSPNQFEFSLTAADMVEAYRKAQRRVWKRYRSWKAAAYLLVLVGLAIGASFWNDWISTPPTYAPMPTTQPAAPYSSIWAPFVPWIVIFLFVWFVVFRLLRGRAKSHRLVGRPHTLIVDDDKITWSEPYSRLEYKWRGFFGFDESENLFLLYLSNPKGPGLLQFHMVPKRAFPSAPLLAEFRGILESNIHPPISAFPVLPISK